MPSPEHFEPKRQPPPKRRLPLRRRLLFALVPLLGLLLAGEIALRLARAPLHFGSFRELRLDLMRRNYPAVLDATLGYAPEPGFRSRDNHWGTQVSINAQGLRENGGDTRRPNGPAIACVGDSFTFGDQVDDGDTWPARLEQLLEQPVHNGGVFGYSLTQTVLRGEQLLERYRPATLIVSLIADDVVRSTYSRRYVRVPWVAFVGDGLELRGVPIAHDQERRQDPERWWKDLIGHSALVDAILAGTARRWWIEQDKQVAVPALQGQLPDLAERLLQRIARACQQRRVRLLVVLQGKDHQAWLVQAMARARTHGIEVLDLVAEFHALAAQDPNLDERWFDGHMTPAGNAWVATRVAAALRR
ncbi:MAG: SGNH/GDSL hydrolase family protein [Planctomycetota bacterium]